MASKDAMPSKQFMFGRYRLVAILLWTSTALGAMVWEYRDSRAFLATSANVMAQASFEKDLLFRHWAAMHGGVYVPVTRGTLPNPYLNVPERDIVTPSGRRLTLMNPAYMTRQIYELSSSYDTHLQGHITSLKPIRTENAPDPWEAQALAAFEKGATEFGGFQSIGGSPHYRFMRPLMTETACLKCHATQGYREGDVRGGISIAIPVAALERAVVRSNVSHELLIAGVWLLGVATIWFGFRKIGSTTSALEAERNNLTTIFDAAPVGMLLVDDRMEVARANEAMRTFCGDFDLLSDRRCGSVLRCVNAQNNPSGCGNSLACDACGLMRSLRNGREMGIASDGELPILLAEADGSAKAIWIHFGVAPVMLDGVRFALLSLMDITERKQSSRRLELLKFALDHVREAAYLIDDHGYFRDVNEEACRVLGYSRDELLRMSVPDIDPDFTFEHLGVTRPELRLRGSLIFEARHKTRDGRIFPVEVSSNYFVYEGLGYNLALSRDITERTLAEQTLWESEERYRMIVDALPVVIFKAYPDGHIDFHDNKIEALSGYGKDEFDSGSLKWLDLIVKDDREQVMALFRETRPPHEAYTFECRIGSRSGKTVWLLARGRLMPGEPPTICGVIIDITEQKELEERCLHAQKLETVGRLSSGVAHDFNNLLTVIIGYGEVLRWQMKGDAELESKLDCIMSAAESAAGLTRQLLAFSRKQVCQAGPLDLSGVISELEPMLRRLIGEDINLVAECEPLAGWVMADRGLMDQVIMNLVVNARDAMPLGGTLSIAVRPVDLDEAYVGQLGKDLVPGRYLMLTVSDTGHGIAKGDIGRVFDPYFTTKEPGKGTGLGLATVHGAVKQSGGDIWVYSEPGRGTTFRIYLPLLQGDNVCCDSPVVVPHVEGKGTGCVLLVEDTDAIRHLIVDFLGSCGYSVLYAADGEEALGVAAGHGGPIQLLITDMVMPGMDGYALMERLAPDHPDMRVLFMSGYTEHASLREDVVNNDAVFLQKPFTMNMLATKVNEALQRSTS